MFNMYSTLCVLVNATCVHAPRGALCVRAVCSHIEGKGSTVLPKAALCQPDIE